MLYHKFWLEARNRFFLGVIFMSCLCLFFVLAQPWILSRWAADEAADPSIYNPPWLLIARKDFTYFIWHFLHNYLLQLTWAVFTIMLALGGLSQESETGSALFTLSLPISRSKLFFGRMLTGFTLALLLALLPVVILPISSSFIGLHYSVWVGLRHALCFMSGGSIIYALGMLINTVAKTETVAFFVAIGSVIAFYFLFQPYAEGTPKPFYIQVIDLPSLMSSNATASYSLLAYIKGFVVCGLLSIAILYYCYLQLLKKDF
jgi:ABC-type transport system involved in multi-copper enzyme maturation permease subunit